MAILKPQPSPAPRIPSCRAPHGVSHTMSDRSQTGTQREKALAQVPNFFISAAGGTATAAKTPIVRSAPALTRRLVRPMPAVKLRRQ